MADNLSIQIDTDRAFASMKALGDEVDRFISKMGSLGSATGGADKVSESIKKIKVDPEVAKSLNELQAKLAALSAKTIEDLKAQIAGLRPDQVKEAAAAFEKLASVTNGLNAGSVKAMSDALKSAGAAGFEAGNSINGLGTVFTTFLSKLTGLNIGTINAAQSFAQMTQSAGSIGAAATQATAPLQGIGAAITGISGFTIGAIAGVAALAASIALLTPRAVEASEAAFKFTTALNTVSKNGLGDALFKSISESALRTGIAFADVSKAATSFGVAANTAGLSTRAIVTTFQSLTVGFRGAGLGADETRRAFTALEQMMSKGKIQAQELVLQLGNAVPGALGIAAKAAGTTTAGLQEMAQAGLLLPDDFVQKFAKEMEKAFGPAQAAQMRTVTSQLGVMSVYVEQFFQALGSGVGSIGLMKGLADVLKGVNDVLSLIMPVVNAVASGLSVVLGGALSAVGFAIQGFVAGIKLIPEAVTAIASTIASAVTSLMNFSVAGVSVRTILDGIGTIIGGIAAGFTAFAGYVSSAYEAVMSFSVGGVTVRQVLEAIGNVIGGVISSIVAFARENSTLVSILAGVAAGAAALWAIFTVGAAAVAGLTLGMGALIAAGALLGAGLASIALGGKQVEGDLSSAAQASRNLKEALAGGFEDVQRLAGGFGTLSAETKRYAEMNQEITRELKNMNREQKEAKAQQEAQTATIRASIAANKERNESLRQQVEAAKRQAQEEKALNTEYEKSIRTSQGAAAAATAKANASDTAAFREKELSRALENSNASIRAQESALNTATAAQKQATESTEAYEARLRRQQEEFTAYGLILTDSNKKWVELGTAMGKADKDAGLFARTMESLLRTQEESNKLAEQETQKKLAMADATNVAITRLREEQVALESSAATKGRLTELDAQRLKGIKEQVAGLESVRGSLTAQALAIEILNGQRQGEIGLGESAARVYEKYSDRLGGAITQQDLLRISQQKQSEDSKKLVEDVKKVTEGTDQAAGAQDKLRSAFTSVGEKIAAIGTSFGEWMRTTTAAPETLDPLIVKLQQFGVEVTNSSAGLSSMSASLSEINTNTGEIVARTEELTKFTAQMALFAATAPQMEALNVSLVTLKTTLEGMKAPLDELAVILPTITSLETQLGVAATQTGVAFTSAKTTLDSYRDALGTLEGPIDSLISKMEALTAAAKEAMAAAQAAASAQQSLAQQGGGGGDVTAPAQRFGGMSGAMYESASVSASAFMGAPSFRDGTASTSNLLQTVKGGGIPTILHPNEAVVPLPKGRSIPVELHQTTDASAISEFTRNLSGGLTTAIEDAMASRGAREGDTLRRDFSVRDSASTEAATLRNNAPVEYNIAQAQSRTPSQEETPRHENGKSGGGNRGGNVTIQMTVNTPDADSFRKSKDQIEAEMYRNLRTAFNRNG